jgi:hypothetical protein
MSLENFNQSIINQIDNEIFLDGNDPEEIEGSFTLFLFTKYNPDSNEQWEVPELIGYTQWIGASWIGDWRENQYSCDNRFDLIQNEMIIRSRMNEYVSRGVLRDFRIRYKYPH